MKLILELNMISSIYIVRKSGQRVLPAVRTPVLFSFVIAELGLRLSEKANNILSAAA